MRGERLTIYENAGYVQIHRWITSARFFQKRKKGIMDNPQTIEEKLKVAEAKLKVAEEIIAVVDLFIKACYEAGEWEFKGHKIKVERGDVVTAQSALAQQWGWRTKGGWDAKRVARFLGDLEAEGWIKIKPVFKSHTIISLLIYVPATQAAKETGAKSAKNLPKNESGENPVNTGGSDKIDGKHAKECGVDSSKKVPISNNNNKDIIIANDDVSDDENKTEDECSANGKENESSSHFEEKSSQVKSSHQKGSKSKSSVTKPAPAPTGGTVIYEYYRNKLFDGYGINHLREAADGRAGKKIFEHFADIEEAKEYVDFAFQNKWIAETGYKFSCFGSNILLNDFEILKKVPKQPIITSYDALGAAVSTKKFQHQTKQITSYDDL